jgi:hypothetical protein
MRIFFCVLAGAALFAFPASAGGDRGHGWGHRHDYWRGGYPAYFGVPLYFAPRVYLSEPYPPYVARYYYFDDDDCEIERRWRHGRYIEEIDCD